MKELFMKILGNVYRVFGMTWITSCAGETCNPVPVYYIVEEEETRITGVNGIKNGKYYPTHEEIMRDNKAV